MNSARDLLRSYMEILSEAPAAPAPTPKAGLSQPPAAGAMRPTNPANSPKQMTTAPSAGPSTAQTSAATTGAGNVPPNSPKQMPSATAPGGQPPAPKVEPPTPSPQAPGAQEPQDNFQVPNAQKVGTTQYGSGPAEEPEEPRSYGPGAATGSWGTTVDGPGGKATRVDPSTGEKTVGDASGSVKTDASGTPISYSAPSLGGMSSTTYTGSAGKGPASGAQSKSFNSGDVSVNQELNPAGKQTSQDTSYTMGATTISGKQGAAGTPTTYSASVDKRAFGNDQDMAAAQGEADKFAQQQQANQGQTVQEEDTHEHPESARHLLKKLLKLLKDEEKVDEGGYIPGQPSFVDQMKKQGTSNSPNSKEPSKSDSPKREAPKSSAANDKDDSEEKLAESLMHLYKAIKEGRIQ